jgi:hypothetical protein
MIMPIDANTLKTIVYQSYRTHGVADWLQRCMRSTQSWAATQGFDYRFIDDRFFDCIPDWYRRGAGGNLQVLANLARIVVAKELLGAGYDRTIWIDADVLVFNPQSFKIDVSSEFAFCREVWMTSRWGAAIKDFRVNNSVTVFVKDNSFIDFAIWAHEELVRRGTQILSHGTTTRLLTVLHQATPLPLLDNVGLLSPIVARDIISRDGALAREYAAAHGTPIYAANLGASLRGATLNGVTLADSHFDFIVDVLDKDRGATFNDVFAR